VGGIETTEIELPSPNEGKHVKIRKITGKLIVESFRKDYGTSIVTEGVVDPELSKEAVNNMPVPLILFLRNAICKFSGYTLRSRYTIPEFIPEYLENNDQTRALVKKCRQIVTKHRLTQFIKRVILSGSFAESKARWHTYDETNNTFGWDALEEEECNELIKEYKLDDMMACASCLNYDPEAGFFSTIIVNMKNCKGDELLEFSILHELQHNLNALSNIDFTSCLEAESLKARVQEYKRKHEIEKEISVYVAETTVFVLNEVYVEREMQQYSYFNTYLERKLDTLLKLAKHYQEKGLAGKERVESIGIAFYLIKDLVIIGSLLEGRNQLRNKFEDCLSCFPSPYVNTCRKAVEYSFKTNIDTVRFEDVFSMIGIFDIFNSSFVSFAEKEQN